VSSFWDICIENVNIRAILKTCETELKKSHILLKSSNFEKTGQKCTADNFDDVNFILNYIYDEGLYGVPWGMMKVYMGSLEVFTQYFIIICSQKWLKRPTLCVRFIKYLVLLLTQVKLIACSKIFTFGWPATR